MAKKFVRGITDIKTINNQDFDTNNVNDLLSDGEHNYIHRKKGNIEEYHNLTDNLKTVTSDNTELIEVTNNNDTDNSATLHPKHDSQKEQSLESESDTITIEHAENGTSETTKVDVNPAKVLLHDNFSVGYGLKKVTNDGVSNISLKPTLVSTGFDLNNFFDGKITGQNMLNAPSTGWYIVNSEWFTDGGRYYIIQTCVGNRGETVNTSYKRVFNSATWSVWKEQVGDKSAIDNLLAQKQNTLSSNASIGISGTGLRQLYALKQTYNVSGGLLKTHVKSVSQNTTVSTAEEEFNFIVKINKGATSATFTLNNHNTTKFTNIMNAYGQNNTVRISGLIFTLDGSSLTVTLANSVNHDYVIAFSDII